MANVLVFAETRANALRKVALEAVSAARAIADSTGGGEVHALVAGTSGAGAVAEQLGRHGADVVVVVEHAGLANFDREVVAATIAARAKSGSYRVVLVGFSAQGRDIGPRIAAKLDAPIVTDIVEVNASADAIVVKHPAYANKVNVTLEIIAPLAVLSIRPSAFAVQTASRSPRSESMAPASDPATSKVVVKEIIEGGKGKL